MQTQLEKAIDLAKTLLFLPLEPTELGPIVVQHPFFESAFLQDEQGIFNALEDEKRYQDLCESYFEKIVSKSKTLEDIVIRVRKSYRLTYINFLYEYKIASKKECGNLVGKVWTTIENINHDVNVPKSRILTLLKAADKEIIMDKEELDSLESLEDTVQIYRGAKDAKSANGLSFTLKKDVALAFATRFNETGILVTANIKKQDIIAYFDTKHEHEIVVDDKKIFNVTKEEV